MASKNTPIPNCKPEVCSMDFWEDGIVILSSDGTVSYTNKRLNEVLQDNCID